MIQGGLLRAQLTLMMIRILVKTKAEERLYTYDSRRCDSSFGLGLYEYDLTDVTEVK